jgi:hypothetical protein
MLHVPPHRESGQSPNSILDRLLGFFSSIWLGVLLLAFLFVYCAVGSAGLWLPGSFGGLIDRHIWIHHIEFLYIPWTQVHIRQSPWLEMTEFEWFHWWPFYLNIALICANLIVATLRRIPLNVVNLGVWMIHTGIIVLAVGSVMYFGTKLEGDAPIVRRQIVIHAPGHEPVAMLALPGNQVEFGGPAQRAGSPGSESRDTGEWRFRVMNIDPDWEILTGEHAGQRSYAVQLAVQTPTEQFVRQLIAGYPQYTEDTIWTGNPQRPMVRAINEIGRRLVDETLEVALDYSPQRSFYLIDSTAVYLREKGEREWVQRPVRGLPRYNDRLDSPSAVWPFWAPEDDPPLKALEIEVPPAKAGDPLPETSLYITSYLRYAQMDKRRRRGGDLDPAVTVRVRDERGRHQDHTLLAFDPDRAMEAGGRLHFRWVASEEEFEQFTNVVDARLKIEVQSRIGEHAEPVRLDVVALPKESPDEPWIEIEGTGYAYRVESMQDNLHLGVAQPVSVAIVQIRSPERAFRRWVFSDPTMPNRDLPMSEGEHGAMHDESLPLDEAIRMTYVPGKRPPMVTILAGPREHDLHLVVAIGHRQPHIQPLRPGHIVPLSPAITLELLDYEARTRAEMRPEVVPPHRRQANDRQQFSMVRALVPGATSATLAGRPLGGGAGAAGAAGAPGAAGAAGAAGNHVWLPYHLYPFAEQNDVLRRFPYRTAEIVMEDGRVIELMLSRERHPLPSPVALNDFRLTTHIGGFTGSTASIRDWTSVVRFRDENGGWMDAQRVSMNKPTTNNGFWFFQAQWDPPDPPRFDGDSPSNGLNFTVLGVGNRNGVWTQLAGCIIAVIGMLYAFYCKAFIKRRRQQAVYSQLQNGRLGSLEDGQ